MVRTAELPTAGREITSALPSDAELVGRRYHDHVNVALSRLARLIGAPVEVRAEGSRVWAGNGENYLDCGGFGVFLLGHRHPKVTAAVHRQLDRQPLSTRLFLNPVLAEAAEELAGVAPTGLEYVFLTNSGAEATELGIKLTRLAGCRRIVATDGGFHGKTLGALSVTGRAQYREPFRPLPNGVEFVPFGDLDSLVGALSSTGGRTAVVLEPVQAEGGVRLPPDGYLAAVRRACNAADAVLVLDEIQTGLGRLGAWWGADRAGVTPDILLTGKILGGGVMPAGAVVATPEMFAPLNADPLLHSSTFAGSPVAAAAVVATIRTLRDEEIIGRSRVLGRALLDLVRSTLDHRGPVREIRGDGLMIGIEFESADTASEFMLGMLERRVIPSYSLNSSTVLRLTPSALLDGADIDALASALQHAADRLPRAC